MRKRIQDAIRLGDLMAQRAHSLSEIHFDAPDRLVVYTTDFPIPLHMGWGNWDDKLERMDRLMSLWKGNEERLGIARYEFSRSNRRPAAPGSTIIWHKV